jgi:hypothetical protein
MAPGIAAPVGSVTVPEILPVTAAQTGQVEPATSTNKLAISFIFIELNCRLFASHG